MDRSAAVAKPTLRGELPMIAISMGANVTARETVVNAETRAVLCEVLYDVLIAVCSTNRAFNTDRFGHRDTGDNGIDIHKNIKLSRCYAPDGDFHFLFLNNFACMTAGRTSPAPSRRDVRRRSVEAGCIPGAAREDRRPSTATTHPGPAAIRQVGQNVACARRLRGRCGGGVQSIIFNSSRKGKP